jgi:PTS system lactose-specific IIC component
MEVPWTTPGFIGTILGTNFDPLSFLLVPLIAIVDAIIYYPFFKVYDQKVLEDEKAKEETELVLAGADGVAVLTEKSEEKLTVDSIGKDKLNILILCAGGGTSGMLANALNDSREELKKEYGIEFTARGGHYGQHTEFMAETDVVILAPQVSSHLTNMQNEAVQYNAIALGTGGAEYINYTRDPKSAAKFILRSISTQ